MIELLVLFRLSQCGHLETDCLVLVSSIHMFGHVIWFDQVHVSQDHWESYLIIPPEVDQQFIQFLALPLCELFLSPAQMMKREQLKKWTILWQ